ncbi:chymotrypsin-like protease CTRL-1 [Fopius arisanus]|uniref:Chymotrypsin-like protease CTRL-1 n=1 Tax=Fopius arisanus TaxID=64838 RepID=A0A9R1TJR9_9HYME|nr:PREDICTED: chymotrypsin-like protease CTRL-1 [Fopius arisanus]
MQLQAIILEFAIYGILCLNSGVDASINSSTQQKHLPSQNISNGDEILGISGGHYAEIGQFPWMAIVHQLLEEGVFMCSGSIISDRWVLTAGHCIVRSPQIFMVIFGETDKKNIRRRYYRGPGVAMWTTRAVLHPQYAEFFNDIGLLYMPRKIPFSATIQPIYMAGPRFQYVSLAGTTAVIAGWGQTENFRGESRLLKWGQLQIISNYWCSQFLSITESNICTAARTESDTCQGDSGAPLVINDGGYNIVVGIVSYGETDCPSSAPGVFTRISSFTNWIARVTNIM